MSGERAACKTNYTVSRNQVGKLVERAGADALKAALIQNGSDPNRFPEDFIISRPQLRKLVERAGEEAVKAALIQNGSAPVDPFG